MPALHESSRLVDSSRPSREHEPEAKLKIVCKDTTNYSNKETKHSKLQPYSRKILHLYTNLTDLRSVKRTSL